MAGVVVLEVVQVLLFEAEQFGDGVVLEVIAVVLELDEVVVDQFLIRPVLFVAGEELLDLVGRLRPEGGECLLRELELLLGEGTQVGRRFILRLDLEVLDESVEMRLRVYAVPGHEARNIAPLLG